MYGFARGFKLDEEATIKLLALGMVVSMLGMAVVPTVSIGDLVWYMTNSDTMGAAATGATGAIIAAGITKSSLAGLALAGAVAGGIVVAIGVGL